MPIGKLSSYPSLSVNVTTDKKRGPEEGGALENEKEDKIISFMEMTEADREQEMMRTGKQDHDGRLAADRIDQRKETIVEKEIREQREREMEFKVQRESVHKTSVHLEPQIQHLQQPQLLIEPVDTTIRAAPPPEIAYHSYPDAQPKLEPVSISVSRPIKTESITASQPGEDRIIRELMEQRSREEELRRHWKEMGLDVTDTDEHGNDAFMGAFKEPEVVKSDATDREEVVLRRKEASVREPNLTSQGHAQEPITVSKNNRNSQEMTRSSSKVQPFEDIEMIQRESMIYRMVPQNETLIEREIRAAHEREAALRQARGLPLENGNSHEDSIEVEVERSSIRLDNSGGTSQNPEQSMKKFAEIRLRSELQKEKKREMDLLQQGKIRSISEHNIGNPMKYIEVVPPDTDHARHFIRSSSATDKPVIKIEASSSVKFSLSLQTIAHEPPRIQQAEPVVEEKYTAAKFIVGSPPAPAASSSKELPVVLRNVSFQGNSLDDASMHHLATRTEADKRIEEEVAEVQRRENELRELRRSITLTDSLSPIQHQFSLDDPFADREHRHHDGIPATNTTTKGVEVSISRPVPEHSSDGIDAGYGISLTAIRKLALIEKWERVGNDGPPYLSISQQ